MYVGHGVDGDIEVTTRVDKTQFVAVVGIVVLGVVAVDYVALYGQVGIYEFVHTLFESCGCLLARLCALQYEIETASQGVLYLKDGFGIKVSDGLIEHEK